MGHLGYATTAHRAQGSTVDTAHALIDPETASRELLYVAMTRGRDENHAYVIQPDVHEVEPHLDPPEDLTRIEQLERVLARSDADLSATETLKQEIDKHTSLNTVLDEYDVLAREASQDRWEALLDIAPFAPAVADAVFTSPYYERLEAALARHEADGHDVTRILTPLAPTIAPGDDTHDPAKQLGSIIDQATRKLTRRRDARPHVAGLIPTPPGPLDTDVQTALTVRQDLIEAGARRLLHHALDADEDWTQRLGIPPESGGARGAWIENATTIALYRYRHDVAVPDPLGNPKQINSPDQSAEFRRAASAMRRLRALGSQPSSGHHHEAPQQKHVRRL